MDRENEETTTLRQRRDECVSILRAAGWQLIAAVRPEGLSDRDDLDLAFVSNSNGQSKLLVRLIEKLTAEHARQHAALCEQRDFVRILNIALAAHQQQFIPCIRFGALRAMSRELESLSQQ